MKGVADGPAMIGSGKLCASVLYAGILLPQEGKLCSIAHSHEVVRINGPGHHAGQPLVIGVVRLDGDGLLVVKTYPAVTTETRRVK